MRAPIALLIGLIGCWAAPLSSFSIIDNFWEIHGSAAGKANLLLLDLPDGSNEPNEKFSSSYFVDLETNIYFLVFGINATVSFSSFEQLNFEEGYFGFSTDIFDVSIGKQRTVWGFGSFFHPSYALELTDEETAELPLGATLWSTIANIPIDESQLSLFGYFEEDSIEELKAPTWGGGSLIFHSSIDIVEFAISSSFLGGDSINNKINAAAEGRFDLSDGFILTMSFGNTINLESQKKRYTPSGLLGMSYSSDDGKQQFSLEGYYDQGIFLASRLSLQIVGGFGGSVLIHLDMEGRGLRLSSTFSYSASRFFSGSFTITYFNGREGSKFYNNSAPLFLGLNLAVSF